MARLTLSLLGPFQVLVDGEPAVGFATAKVRALLAYLAVEADRPHTREALAALLWPDWPGRHALSNLRQALANLRATLHDRDPDDANPLLLVSRESIQFNRASDHALDVTVFEQGVRKTRPEAQGIEIDEEERIGTLAACAQLYRGPFLDELSIDSAPFEEWLTLQREHWQREVLAMLQQLAGLHERRGQYPQARACARRALAMEPTDEWWHRQLMRSLALGGEHSAALAQYETCCRVLDEELAVKPARETTALYEEIRRGALAAPTKDEQSPPPASDITETPRSLFVARELELAQLEQWLGEALRGRGRVGFVVGEPGSGKTTLMNEFAQRAMEAHPDLVTAGGSCNAYTGIGDPYLPFVEVLAMLSGDREVTPAEGAIAEKHRRRLDALLPATLQALIETGPILVDVMVSGASILARFEHLLPDRRAWRARVEEAIRHRTSQALQQTDLFTQYTRVLQALARGHPLLILLDDLQWADTGSLGLLFHLGRRLAGSRILVLGAYRPEEVALGRDGEQHPLEPVVNEFQRIWGDVRIDLAEAEGWRLVTEIIDSQPNRLGPGFREALYRHTGGQALFTVEMLRGLQERGDLLRDEAGRWVEGASLDWATFPNRIESVIAQQLGRLPPGWRELLATASVEGEEFTAEVVARVQGVDEHTVAHALNGTLGKQYHLVNAQSTRLMGSQHLSRYRFRHHLFQHYLYQGLNAVERAHLHEEMGNSLEALYGATPEFLYESARLMAEDRFGELYGSRAVEVASIVPQLAWHYDAAGLVEKAVAYLSQAAFSAARSFAPKVALPHITRRVELLQSLPFTPELARREMSFEEMLGLMRGLTMGFTVAGARQAIERVCELARRAGDDANLVLGAAWIVTVLPESRGVPYSPRTGRGNAGTDPTRGPRSVARCPLSSGRGCVGNDG